MNDNDNTMLLIGIVGAAAGAIYFVVKKQQQQTAAAAIARSAGVPVPLEPPSFFDTLMGKVPDVIKQFEDKGKALDARAKVLGPKVYEEFKRALKKGNRFFAAEVAGKVTCFETATLSHAPGKCTAAQQRAAMLEGWY